MSKVWESTHACVVKFIRAWLPSQAPRGGLASQTRTCMGSLRPCIEDSDVRQHPHNAPVQLQKAAA